jgi:type IV pilus assembly protein PilY1
MILSKARMSWIGLGALWALLSGLPALADDTELFIGNTLGSQAKPNILFIIDNSGSMGSLVVTQEGFDGNTTYPAVGSCDANRVYWRTGTGNPPGCGTNNYFNLSALKCQRALNAFVTAGYYTDNMAQYDPNNVSGGKRWETISASQKSRVVECQDDRGAHGDTTTPPNLYARNGQSGVAGYWGDSTTEIAWGATPANEIYTLYSGNYLNWAYGPTGFKTRLEIVQDVASDLLDTVSDVNVGLVYFNGNSGSTDNGGLVAHAIEDIETSRSTMQATINGLTPGGFTPLSETLYESAMYYLGDRVTFGTGSVAESRDPGDSSQYLTPIDYNCQKNFIVLLTDGEPTRDDAADSSILNLADFPDDSVDPDRASRRFGDIVGASCDAETYPSGFSPSGGECLDDLAEFLAEGDMSPLDGEQSISTYTIGFTLDLPILADTAERGDGRYYTADDTATLANALTSIVTTILSEDTTFTAPTVAVNAFNRTQNLSDLFISVFRPSGRTHWPGNLKKYQIRASDATIMDARIPSQPAVNPATGFFYADAQSGWSGVVDGADVETGGAASLIPAHPNRLVYTHLDGNALALTHTSNRVNTTNLNDTLLGIQSGDPSVQDVVDFINNLDVPDANGNSSMTDPRNQLGDPLHSQPVSVIYGPGLRQGLVFMATNDGYLHAIDLESGVERWAFIPEEFLPYQVDLYKDESEAAKQYGIDSDLRVQVVADHDGVIDYSAGETVTLFFGMGRGGDFYYALDVSNPDAPALKWRADGTTLPGLGQTWSSPTPTKVNIDGVVKQAVIMGGGYEPDQDNAGLTTDTIGNSIYIVDATDGSLLWHGSRAGTHENFAVAGRAMDYSIPAPVRVVDIDGDGLADRIYAGDMGGQLWRFDIHNGAAVGDLVTGGVIAQLGGAPATNPAPEDIRRFYNAPDGAFINTPYGNFIHIGIGSGHRGHPLSVTVEDAFYAVRDYNTSAMTQTQFDALTPIVHDDLTPVTTASTSVPFGSDGWRIDLNIGGWNGEKVLAEARTFANQVIFSTFQPSDNLISCEPQPGINRTYAMAAYNGAPVLNLDDSVDPTTLTMDDLFVEAEGGILSSAQALFVDRDSDSDGIPDVEDDSDDDGLSDANDDDDDNDNVADEQEDLDSDGVPNYADADDDGDGMEDDVDNDDRRANANEDADGDGVANSLDTDDDGDGVPDVDDDDDDVVCVSLRCFSGVMSNDPIRTLWAQESVD